MGQLPTSERCFWGWGVRQRELQVEEAMTSAELPEKPGGIGALGMASARTTSCSLPHTHSLTHNVYFSSLFGLCLYIYTHACIHAYMHTCILTYIHTYIHAVIYICIYMYRYVGILLHMHAYMHTSIHAYTHACTSAPVHPYVRTYIHSYIE